MELDKIHPEARSIFGQLSGEPEISAWLGRLRDHHPETHEHCLRVGQMSADIGKLKDFDRETLADLCAAGLLHDVGKIHVPLDILDKPGRLDDDEMQILQHHCRAGFELLAEFQPATVPQVVVAHHEFKVNAYPRDGSDRRLKTREDSDRRTLTPNIKSMAQIVAAVDMFDALASGRSYKDALSFAELSSIIRSQFTGDPSLVDLILDKYRYDDITEPDS
jgi:HD-GYP domain-containing protein (c-di-GMP phosphodiesterase class II)